jgi:hypothetical protein
MVDGMADEKEAERVLRRFRLFRNGRREQEDGRDEHEVEPGRRAAGRDRRDSERNGRTTDRASEVFESDARDERLRADTRNRSAAVRPGTESPEQDFHELRQAASDLRDRATDGWSQARVDDALRAALLDNADGRDDPAAVADRRRADWLGADADRNQRNARADDREAEALAAQADAAPHTVAEAGSAPPLPTDGAQAPARDAVRTPPPHAPAARRANLTRNQRTPRQRSRGD